MNKGQKSLTGIALVVFVALGVGLNLAHWTHQNELIGLGVLMIVYIGMIFMLKTAPPK
jgi:hypothetical protein